MATGYKNVQMCKTLILPMPKGSLSVAQYKERYGIDLSEFLSLEGGNIYFDSKGSLVLIRNDTIVGAVLSGVHSLTFPVGSSEVQGWTEGVNEGYTIIGAYNPDEGHVYGIMFAVGKDVDFTIDNLRIESASY